MREWSTWKSELSQLKDVIIPRCFGNGVTTKSIVELHGFGDASPKAYGAAVYIQVTNGLGQVSSQLMMSKSRVGLHQACVTAKTRTASSTNQC